jgi:hypothetical protein
MGGYECQVPHATEKDVRSNVGYGVLSGLVLLTMSFVGRDPKATSCRCATLVWQLCLIWQLTDGRHRQAFIN